MMPTDFGNSSVGLALKIDPGCSRAEAKRGAYCGADSTLHVCKKHKRLAELIKKILALAEKEGP